MSISQLMRNGIHKYHGIHGRSEKSLRGTQLDKRHATMHLTVKTTPKPDHVINNAHEHFIICTDR